MTARHGAAAGSRPAEIAAMGDALPDTSTKRPEVASGALSGPSDGSARKRVRSVSASRSESSKADVVALSGRTTVRGHLTLAEVCADLGISRSTFYDWRAKKRAPRCIKLPNGDLRIRRTDYESWLESLAEDVA